MEPFAKWLAEELQRHGWSQSEAARRGKFAPSMMNQVLSGNARPGLRFCQGIARAFDLPVEEVMRRAGLLSNAAEVPGEDDLLRYFRSMPEEDRGRLLALARALWQESQR
jgi:transcriptional regulator with XRE-family HTH domain